MVQRRSRVRRIGYFGSYAKGNAGVGSDLDLIAIVSDSDERFERRAVSWDTTELPVPAELLVYTVNEWQRMMQSGTGFSRTLREETRWLFNSD